MRKDPRAACANEKEAWPWAFVHDLLAHPLMAITNYCAIAIQFHDWTSLHAWPRNKGRGNAAPHFVNTAFGLVRVEQAAPGCWRTTHPKVNHAVVTGGQTAEQAATLATAWFFSLAEQHAGDERFQATRGAA